MRRPAFPVARWPGWKVGIAQVARDIGEGTRAEDDVPVHFIVRNSWDAGWGVEGNLRVPFADFQVRDGHGVLFNDDVEPPSCR